MQAPMRTQRYQWVQNSGKGYIVLPGLNSPAMSHFFGTRLLSDAEEPVPWADLKRKGRSVRSRQIHGDQIIHVTEETLGGEEPPAGDALITDLPGILLAVSTADCVPILLLDPNRKAVAAVHAGWRGTLLNISAKTALEMAARFGSDPGDLLAGIGPSIGSCCYEVGPDVWREAKERFPYGKEAISRQSNENEKATLDLANLNRLQLVEAGLDPEKIALSGLCSFCNPNLFYSYRRDKKRMGHMISGVLLTAGFHE
ncbi:MAG TPA: peptidoglycan editing factor PgeF [Candidatus Manganitrophaceae bacterium]|nr:peptidoglycan editing factor PgeF [Candidatus Manganitrophaceae bacterium]